MNFVKHYCGFASCEHKNIFEKRVVAAEKKNSTYFGQWYVKMEQSQ